MHMDGRCCRLVGGNADEWAETLGEGGQRCREVGGDTNGRAAMLREVRIDADGWEAMQMGGRQ